MVHSRQMGICPKIWLTLALWSQMSLTTCPWFQSLTHINPRLPALSQLTWCASSGSVTALLDLLVLDMQPAVLDCWRMARFWLLAIQWISRTCWDTMDILSYSVVSLSRNLFICFKLSNLHSSTTYLVESISTTQPWPQAEDRYTLLLLHSTYLKRCSPHVLTAS